MLEMEAGVQEVQDAELGEAVRPARPAESSSQVAEPLPQIGSPEFAQPDIVIRRGTIVDGTGSSPFVADIAVTGSKIVAIGPDLDVVGKEEHDANGMIVAPGWIDPHTHLDAQWSWDPYLSPSSGVGVTTCVMGNCGIGFAPCQADRRRFLAKLLESVEDVPEQIIAEGLVYDFETFEEYMDSIARKELAVDLAVMVGHCAIRAWVMGENAGISDKPGGRHKNPVKAEEVAKMAQLVRDAVAVGAFGFSTSRFFMHRDSKGALMPGSLAEGDELRIYARAVAEGGGGVLQMSSDFMSYDDLLFTFGTSAEAKGRKIEEYRRKEMAWLRDVATEHGAKVALTFNVIPKDIGPSPDETVLNEISRVGGVAYGQTFLRQQGFLLKFGARVHPFILSPTFKKLAASLSGADLLARLQQSEIRSKVIYESDTSRRFNFNGLRGIRYIGMWMPWSECYLWTPGYEPSVDQSIEAIAASENKRPIEVAYDVLVAGGVLWKPLVPGVASKQDAFRSLMERPDVIPGFADAGAHGTMFQDAAAATHALTHWTRDRTQGPRIAIEKVVKWQTSDVAKLFGMPDRGTLAPGMRADLNIIDLKQLKVNVPFIKADLPLQTERWYQEVDGYVLTVVAGVPTYRNGQRTGKLPGRLLRNPRADRSAHRGIAREVAGRYRRFPAGFFLCLLVFGVIVFFWQHGRKQAAAAELSQNAILFV